MYALWGYFFAPWDEPICQSLQGIASGRFITGSISNTSLGMGLSTHLLWHRRLVEQHFLIQRCTPITSFWSCMENSFVESICQRMSWSSFGRPTQQRCTYTLHWWLAPLSSFRNRASLAEKYPISSSCASMPCGESNSEVDCSASSRSGSTPSSSSSQFAYISKRSAEMAIFVWWAFWRIEHRP